MVASFTIKNPGMQPSSVSSGPSLAQTLSAREPNTPPRTPTRLTRAMSAPAQLGTWADDLSPRNNDGASTNLSALDSTSALRPRAAMPLPSAAPVTLVSLPDDVHPQIASRLSMRDLEAVASTGRALHQAEGAFVSARNQLWALGASLQNRTDSLHNEESVESVFQHLLTLGLGGDDEALVARLPPALRAEEITVSIQRIGLMPTSPQAGPVPVVRSAPSVTRAIESLEPPRMRDSPLSAYIALLGQQEQVGDLQNMMPWLLQMAAQVPATHRRMTLEALLTHGIPNLHEAGRAEVLGQVLDWAAQAPVEQRGEILLTAVQDALPAIPDDQQLNEGVRLMNLAATLPKDEHVNVLSLLMERSHIHFPQTSQAAAFVATKAHWPTFDNLSQWRPLLRSIQQHIERQPCLHGAIFAHEVVQHLTGLEPSLRGSALATWVGFNHPEIPALETLVLQSLQDIHHVPASLRAELVGTLAPVVRQHADTNGDALWRALMEATLALSPQEQVHALTSHLEIASSSRSSSQAKQLHRLRPVLGAQLSTLPAPAQDLLKAGIRQHASLPFQRLVLGEPAAFVAEVPFRFHAHLEVLDEIATVHPDAATAGPRAIRLALAALDGLENQEDRLTLVKGTIDAAIRLHLEERVAVLQDVVKAAALLPAHLQSEALRHLAPVLQPTLEEVMHEVHGQGP